MSNINCARSSCKDVFNAFLVKDVNINERLCTLYITIQDILLYKAGA